MKSAPHIAVLAGVLALGGALGFLLGGNATPAGHAAAWTEVSRSVHAVSLITVPVDKNSSLDRALETAERAYDQLTAGADFADVARRVSLDPLAQSGGFAGFLNVNEDKALTGAAQALRPGEFSFPIRSRIGFQIVKRHSFEEARKLEAATTIPAHGVFVTYSDVPGDTEGRTRAEAREIAETLLADLRSGKVTLDEAAERHTPENQRGPQAFLGMVTNQDRTAQAFAALEKIKPGEFTGPVAERQGWAVLMRGRHFRSLVKHILIQHLRSKGRDIRISRTPAQALELAKKVLADVRKDPSKWNSAVERFTDDKTGITSGGSLGVAQIGELPPGFGDFIHDVAPGAIHDEVVESPAGYHIVWRVN